jgi:hypothetical protein
MWVYFYASANCILFVSADLFQELIDLSIKRIVVVTWI